MPEFENEYEQHRYWMKKAIAAAQRAGDAGEVPVGAILIDQDGTVLAETENQKERTQNPTAHAEVLAIQQGTQHLQDWHLNHCTLYVTLEPCPMCAGAIIQSRIGTLVFGADDPKTGAIRSVINLPDHPVSFHRLQVWGGICEKECRAQLQTWFQARRVAKQRSKRTVN